MAKELALTEQTFKTVRLHYKMTPKEFLLNMKPIRKELDNMVKRSNYRKLTPKQVLRIKKHLEG